MKFEWEKIYEKDFDTTWRAKLIGGWLVKTVIRTSETYSTTMVFIDDRHHRWSTEENCQIDIDIEDFHVMREWFSLRITNCFKAQNIRTIRDLLSWCEHQLCCTPNLGKKSLIEINNLLQLAGLKLNSYPHTSQGEFKSKCRECILRE
jgi:hypothetical protein